MRLLLGTISFAIITLSTACPPTPSPAPGPDASDAAPPAPRDAAPNPDATPVQQACANLASLACAEGVDEKCAIVLQRAIDARLTTFDLPCLTSAKTKADVRACSPRTVACP